MERESSTARGPVQVGSRAPDFTLPDPSGRPVRLSDYVGKSAVVLYFYPKDYTLGCTREACAFRDRYESFKAAGAEVIGISSDPPGSHERFASQYQLPFLLLSDVDGEVSKLYGVRKVFGLLRGRVTFVIDREGIVRQIYWNQLAFEKHVTEALTALTKT
ncbi:MAG TPA: peroxiredoxin [Chloroflexota bacterium]|nr:peroxiredoxin [Chloroflexota bacterium]